MPSQKKDSGNSNEALKYSGMAVKMAVAIAAGVFGGQYLDEKMGNANPWMTIILSLIGVAVAIYFVITDTSK
ncbi:AtpZ/AtpI family protein [Cryomorpha ignava]|uniref:AtpZ/AtpI family protein n=1 Tax=Cryomorpha ignava TaxID=101383 RepID=A0A7K3WSN3_9FLAO|nr:AtpZ/AtpI family protein [Cryomorpha ignava]NEN24538.1 AtpZ/AtpI family protein [Cryomorpha ignava]